jgi:hypothetical protein
MRTALLIRCARTEADRIRAEAIKGHRTISNYVIGILMRTIESNGRLDGHSFIRVPEPRAAILVRCDVAEAEQIREAARRYGVPINAFVLHALKTTWNHQLRRQ